VVVDTGCPPLPAAVAIEVVVGRKRRLVGGTRVSVIRGVAAATPAFVGVAVAVAGVAVVAVVVTVESRRRLVTGEVVTGEVATGGETDASVPPRSAAIDVTGEVV
jgi:hypothetical protein